MKLQQQQQESTQSKSDDIDYQVHKYKNIINSKQQELNILAQPQHFNTTASGAASSLSATGPPSIRGPILQVAVHDQGEIRSSRLLQIVRRWTQRNVKEIAAPAQQSTCSMLNFVPLSCITFSSIHLHSDNEDDDHGNEIDIASDSLRKSTKIQSPRLHRRSRSAYTTQSSHKPTMKKTQCTGKERDSIRAPVRRALSCPSPLSSCTAFSSLHCDEQDGEELECLQPKQEAEDYRIKLKRSSSSPLRRHNILSKPPKGYLAVYVGEERRRFLVKANFLNHPLFSVLLDKAKEEFGFDQKGPLNIPCDIAFFQHIMFLVESNDPSYKNADTSSILLHFNSANNQLATSVAIGP